MVFDGIINIEFFSAWISKVIGFDASLWLHYKTHKCHARKKEKKESRVEVSMVSLADLNVNLQFSIKIKSIVNTMLLPPTSHPFKNQKHWIELGTIPWNAKANVILMIRVVRANEYCNGTHLHCTRGHYIQSSQCTNTTTTTTLERILKRSW